MVAPGGNLVVGQLESTQWNPEQPYFNQMQEQEENWLSSLAIITVPEGQGESPSERQVRDKPPQAASSTTATSQLSFSIESVFGFKGGSGGNQPPSGLQHTYNYNCPACSNGLCKELIQYASRILQQWQQWQQWMNTALCNLGGSQTISGSCYPALSTEQTSAPSQPVAVVLPFSNNSQSSTQRLREHEARHRGRLTCFTCNKSYSRIQRLKEHEARHRGELTCSTCNKSYSSIHRLRKHVASHQKRPADDEYVDQSKVKRQRMKTNDETNNNE